ncbi:MAG: P1 family peptidase [Inquilinus sp.]|nr:P1 family peptidase [Inquilinus sp.]
MALFRPGPRNLITDVAGILVGNAHDARARTGTTVVLPDQRAVAAVDVRGGGPGTRETDALDPTALVDAIDAVVLSGGSAFGLAAADGAVAWLAARGRGYRLGPSVVPIVPAAILFDLQNGGDKGWGEEPPYRALAMAACAAAASDFPLGNQGAGFGAKAGSLKGGLGSASIQDPASGITLGAVLAANPVGSTVMPGQDALWAWALELDGELGGQPQPTGPVPPTVDLPLPAAEPGTNTTIGVIATDADLSRAEARRIAMAAQDGIARAIRPAHTPFDGDTLFVLATGAVPLPEPRPLSVARLGALAADVVARAIARAVYEAETLGDWPSYRSRHGGSLRQP